MDQSGTNKLDRQRLEAKLAQLRSDFDALRSNLDAVNGAIQLIELFLQELDEKKGAEEKPVRPKKKKS